MAETQLPVTALALFILFGANWVVYSGLWLHKRSQEGGGGAERTEGSAPAKKRSEPLALTLPSVRSLSHSLAFLGILICIAWLCEHHPPFAHSKKIHDMDMFWFLAFALAALSFFNVKKSKGGDILNREQTEEWKGWMQFLFLMYHYFSAHEVYNSIRVMITSYVWMTGFGNFSFFYMKGDFGAVRLLQMLWRLNFLVCLLCMVMGNTYILYYICPLHTFYFFFVFATMRVMPSVNHQKWGIRVKLLVVAAIVYCVWDVDSGLFDKIFFFLGDTPKIGASSGSMWEWYFRSSLDHWSTFLGMIFALNFPLSMLWLKKVEGLPAVQQWAVKGSVAVVCLCACWWWATHILPLPKLDYNASNAYFGCLIPMLSYIYMRNLSPLLRTTYLEPLHSLGKVTLETYLMQHHVFLTSNAKTVLTLVPGMPKVNLLVGGVLYWNVSQHLHNLTLFMRGILLPDNLRSCIVNLMGIGGTLLVCLFFGHVVQSYELAWQGVIGFSLVLGVATLIALHLALIAREKQGTVHGGTGLSTGGSLEMEKLGDRKTGNANETQLEGQAAMEGDDGDEKAGLLPLPDKKDEEALVESEHSASIPRGPSKARYDGGLLRLSNLLPALVLSMASIVVVRKGGFGMLLSHRAGAPGTSASEWGTAQTNVCLSNVNNGMWKTSYGACEGQAATAEGYCNTRAWKWIDVPDQCSYHFISEDSMMNTIRGRHVKIIGDSVQRYVYLALLRSVGVIETIDLNSNEAKHSDKAWEGKDGTSITFKWAAFAEDISGELEAMVGSGDNHPADLLIVGGGLWDALHEHNAPQYGRTLETVAKHISRLREGKGVRVVWSRTTAVVEAKLESPSKKEYLSAAHVAEYTDAADSSGVMSAVDAVLDGYRITSQHTGDTEDGIHYADFIYDAFAQIHGNIMQIFGWGARRRTSALAPPVPPSRHHQRILELEGHHIGKMANPFLGALVVGAACIMILYMDAYVGLTRLAMSTIGQQTLVWEDAYGPLLSKLGRPLQ